MDKLSDIGTITGGTALIAAIGGIVYTTNKINEVRKDLDEVTGHLAITIGEKGTIDKINENIDKLSVAMRHLNSNINEIATVITKEQELRDQQFSCILDILKEVGDVPEVTTRLLNQKLIIHSRVEPITPPVNIAVKNTMSEPFHQQSKTIIDGRRSTLSSMGL